MNSTLFTLEFPVGWSHEKSVLDCGESTIARLKLKGIDGGTPQGVELAAQFDSTRGNLPGPDPVRTDRLYRSRYAYALVELSRYGDWWCMAVLSPWSDLSGRLR